MNEPTHLMFICKDCGRQFEDDAKVPTHFKTCRRWRYRLAWIKTKRFVTTWWPLGVLSLLTGAALLREAIPFIFMGRG